MNSLEEIRYAAIPYVFIILPFIALILVKGFTGNWGDLLVTSDWAVASAMIYSSSIINVRSAAKEYKGNINELSLDWFMSITIFMATISVVLYVLVLLVPSTALGIAQILLFIYASLSHFKFGRMMYRLKNK
ncbi:hypothetical protein PVK63_19690, partial [Aliivibrio sp. S2TY2]